MTKGIGPVTATRIVTQFGMDTLDVIEDTPEKLMEVHGIGVKRVGMITRAWKCAKCNEQVEDNFAHCWKCGTWRDGSPPLEKQVFAERQQDSNLQNRNGVILHLAMFLGPKYL